MRNLFFSSLLFLQLFLPLQISAQEQTPEAGETAASGEETATQTFQWVEDIREVIVAEPIKALVAAVFAIFIVPVLQNIAHRYRISKIFSGVKIPSGHKKNSIMMIGLGGSGKTTLSRRICGDMNKDPSAQTEEFQLFDGVIENGGQKYDYYVSDYRGQNVGSLITGFIAQQLVERSPFRFGHVNSLILVVDILESTDDLINVPPVDHPKTPKIESERVAENIAQWNRTALDAIFGMHTIDSLKYVCLFINKKDRLESWSPAVEQQILDAYKPLSDDLERRCSYDGGNLGERRYAVFDTFIGSAATDVPVQLLHQLQTLSVPLTDLPDQNPKEA